MPRSACQPQTDRDTNRRSAQTAKDVPLTLDNLINCSANGSYHVGEQGEVAVSFDFRKGDKSWNALRARNRYRL
jgi:hypothetical protein